MALLHPEIASIGDPGRRHSITTTPELARATGTSAAPRPGCGATKSRWKRSKRVAFPDVTCNIGRMARRQSSSPTAIRVRAHRQRLREQGLRPIQIWVPDVRSPQFTVQAHQQSLAVASSRHAADDQAFIDALADDE